MQYYHKKHLTTFLNDTRYSITKSTEITSNVLVTRPVKSSKTTCNILLYIKTNLSYLLQGN